MFFFIIDGCSFNYAHIWSNQAFRIIKGIWFNRKSLRIHFLLYTCAACSELPSYISTLGSLFLLSVCLHLSLYRWSMDSISLFYFCSPCIFNACKHCTSRPRSVLQFSYYTYYIKIGNIEALKLFSNYSLCLRFPFFSFS